MISTGIIKQMDDFGRIILPSNICLQAFGTKDVDGKSMEIFYEKDGTIILKPYNLKKEEKIMTVFEKFCDDIQKIRGAEVYGDIDDEPYVELGIISDTYIEEVYKILQKYGYKITEENECEGSDYPSYCIWFTENE